MPSTQKSRASQPTGAFYRQIRPPLDKPIVDSPHHFELDPALSAHAGINHFQILGIVVLLIFFSLMTWHFPHFVGGALHWSAWLIFFTNGLFRLLSALTSTFIQHNDHEFDQDNLPIYTIMVALYKEASIIQQLTFNLKQINYPTDRLEIFILLEQDDTATLSALSSISLPAHFHVLIVPEGSPKTKPRALNYGLGFAKGDFVVVYDAEDRPEKDQLLQAAETFKNADPRLICLQAPLRPVGALSFIGKQFTLEYSLQFENFLPFLNNLGLPFPLGGTSNHFNAKKLREVGGWDAHNVTEDADLGIRLSRYGYLSGLIDLPTYESAPESLKQWIPQRTRWIKGYLQTLIVHLRAPWLLPPKALISMLMSLGLGTASTLLYAPLSLFYLSTLGMWIIMSLNSDFIAPVPFPYADTALFLVGNFSLVAALKVSSKRRSRPMAFTEALGLPIYWCLQSISGIFAVHQLLTKPFHWDKTDHTPILQPQPTHK